MMFAGLVVIGLLLFAWLVAECDLREHLRNALPPEPAPPYDGDVEAVWAEIADREIARGA